MSVLVERRKQLGMSQDKLAEHSGVSQPVISRAERGVGTALTLPEFLRICEALELAPVEVLRSVGA